ncbi:MAG: ferritin [Candidatus Auribacterota bacterium]|jgi:ferritin|uniref:Ferritin n=1 Tax=Candidatus Auribacter fodinae TaxID=2093366 RepID=A0A3A4QXI2_9BACT|nr:MAG: ferritin [Candidatus Auribacter fodinae]
MISKQMQDKLNDQINLELYSSYIYASMAAYFDSINLDGFSSWMKAQAGEELKHAMKVFGYVCERAGRVELKAIAAPKIDWASPLAAFEDAYKHECHVSSSYHKLVDVCQSEKDFATLNFIQWFIAEQVEEEDSVLKIVEQLKIVKDAPGGLFMIDRGLAQRQG